MSETRAKTTVPFDGRFPAELDATIASYLSSNSIVLKMLHHKWSELSAELREHNALKSSKRFSSEKAEYEELCHNLIAPYYQSHPALPPDELIPHSFALNFINDYRAIKKSEHETMIAMTWPHSLEKAKLILKQGSGIVWEPDFSESFIKATPWLKSCRLGCNYMLREKGVGILDISIKSYSIPDQIPISHLVPCSTLILSALNNDYPVILRNAKQSNLKDAYDFLSENHVNIVGHSVPEIANSAFEGMGQLIIAAEENKQIIKEKLSQCDKQSVMTHLLSTIEEINSIPELKKMYDRYNSFQFLAVRDNPLFDDLRDVARETFFKEKPRFTKRKIAFIEALQQRACEMIAGNVQLKEKFKDNLNVIFSRELIKHGVSDRWIANYESNGVGVKKPFEYRTDTCCRKLIK